MNRRPALTLAVLLVLAVTLTAVDLSAQVPGVSREQMWYAPTAEDWKKPCLITFQRTWEDAVKISKETKKPILICINMDGEIASEHYAGIRYRQPDIAKLYEPYVCVIASTYRHTPRDYDENGNRILCPRFGSVTCGEHIWIEPPLYEKFMDGQRVAPRHIMVELDGKETYDVFYAFDTDSVFKAIKDGIANRKITPNPTVRGDRSIVERVASADIKDREAVEDAYKKGDRNQRRALLDAALAMGGEAPLELLRLAIFGFDEEMGKKARQALARSDTKGAVDLISEALRVPLESSERDSLVAALERLGQNDYKAQRLSAVHKGIASGSRTVDVEAWARAVGATYKPASEMDPTTIATNIEKMDEVASSENAEDHLNLAETYISRALKAESEHAGARTLKNALFADALGSAERARGLGATGWRVNTALAVSEYYLGNVEAAYAHAEAAMKDLPETANDWNSMIVLGLFAESRRKSIQNAVENQKKWPGQWLSDLHAAYSVLARHPHGDADQVALHYDFLMWLGAGGQASRALTVGIRQFPGASGLHQRLRRRILRQRGVRGLTRVYDDMLAAKDADPVLRWYAGYAAIVAAEFHRRRGKDKAALASYQRGIDLYEQGIKDLPESKDDGDHYIAMALGGRARIAFEAEDWNRCLQEVLAAFERRADSSATLDGLNISTVDTAKMLLARLKDLKKNDLAEQLQAAMDRLDPRLLELPAYEGVGPRNNPGRGQRGGRRGGRRGNRQPGNRPPASGDGTGTGKESETGIGGRK